MDTPEREAAVNALMASRAARAVIAADASKIGGHTTLEVAGDDAAREPRLPGRPRRSGGLTR